MSTPKAQIEAIVKTAVSKSTQQATDLLKTPKNYNQIKGLIKNKLQSSIVSFLGTHQNEITGDIFKQLHQHFLNEKLSIIGEPIIEPTSNNIPYSAIFDFRDLDNQQDFSIELEISLAFYSNVYNEECCKIEEIEIKNIFTVSEMKAKFNKVNTLLKTLSKKELYLLLSNFTN